MKRITALFWNASPSRVGLESLGLACILFLPLLPILLEAPPLPFSLYLVQFPLICSCFAALRLRFFSGNSWQVILKEIALGMVLGLGTYGFVYGTFLFLGEMDVVRFSYAGNGGTTFFLWMVVPEYLGMRFFSWLWQRWRNLRKQRYAWALTHSILIVVSGIALFSLITLVIYTVNALNNDIWGISPGNPFAETIFWLSVVILFSFLLIVGCILVFLPPATLFSFLVARRMTKRLEELAEAVQSFKKGDFTKRVVKEGEDEIAQLQDDFNIMASDLENSIQELNTEKNKVLSLLETQRELVDGISHELRNPAAIILGYVESLRRDWTVLPPQKVEQNLKTVQYEITRLQTILNDLLLTSQIETDRLMVTLCDVPINQLAEQIVDTFCTLAWNRKRVLVTLNLPEDEIIAIADPLRLEQVLVNLVQNAVQYTSPGGVVAIEIQKNGDKVGIDVEDTGEGISAEDLTHIWEKYHHSGKSSLSMGLGLSLVKEMTEAMGGTVSVESILGQGSVFRILLPVCNRN